MGKDIDNKKKGPEKMGPNDTWTSVEDVIRQNNREIVRYWIAHTLMFLVGGILCTLYWWVWILLGLFIEHFR